MRKPRRTRFSASTGTPIIRDVSEHFTIVDDPDPSETKPAEDGAPSPESRPAPDGTVPPSWLRLLTSRRPRGGKKTPVVPIACACLALGLAAGYLLARSLGGTRASGTAGEARIRLEASEQEHLDAAYDAAYQHRYKEAEALFAALGRKHPDWASMEVERGRVLLYEGNISAAYTALNEASTRSSSAAEARFTIGVINIIQKDYLEAEASLAAAVANDPTRPDIYYLWGDCLRDQGKPREAMEKFRSGLLRNRFETANGLYRLKLWLSQIDADQENSDGLMATITAGLAQPLPPMEILFAAASRDLKAGDFPAAAKHIEAARERTDPDVFHVVLNDPTFVQARHRPELAETFRLVSAPAPESTTATSTPATPTK